MYDQYAKHSTNPELLSKQTKSVQEEGVFRCECGTRMSIKYGYRCLYCGLWMCAPCAEKHFGKTFDEWNEEHNKNNDGQEIS